ncbi:MAG: hypothetical protein U5S82_19465 [Gammaproteobacteria bacterium]|nr:hypothetical protein [Gammaproteobacteria bacterium]
MDATLEAVTAREEVYRRVNEVLRQAGLAFEPRFVSVVRSKGPGYRARTGERSLYAWSRSFNTVPNAVIHELAAAKGLDELLVSAGRAVDGAKLRRLLESARERGTRVSLVLAHNPWALPANHAAAVARALETARLHPDIHLDVEPHTLPGFDAERERHLHDFVALVGKVRAALPDGTRLSVAVPVFWDVASAAARLRGACVNGVYLMALRIPEPGAYRSPHRARYRCRGDGAAGGGVAHRGLRRRSGPGARLRSRRCRHRHPPLRHSQARRLPGAGGVRSVKLRNRKSHVTRLAEGEAPASRGSWATKWFYYLLLIAIAGYAGWHLLHYILYLEVRGQIEVEKTRLASPRGGIVERIAVLEGQRVVAGQALAVIGPEEACPPQAPPKLDRLELDLAMDRSRWPCSSGSWPKREAASPPWTCAGLWNWTRSAAARPTTCVVSWMNSGPTPGCWKARSVSRPRICGRPVPRWWKLHRSAWL